METDPGESTDYVDFPTVKPFINSPSSEALRRKHDVPSTSALPVTQSASILSALESLQRKIKKLEMSREKTLFDLETAARKVSLGASPIASSPDRLRSSPDRASTRRTLDQNVILDLNPGEKFDERNPVVTETGVTTLRTSSNLNESNIAKEVLPSNPSTPRNVKEAKELSSAIGKHLQFVETECGSVGSSLQNLRAKVLISQDRRPSSRSSPDEIGRPESRLSALQNLEKERATLKISQSLAEARIRLLEKELECNRHKRDETASRQNLDALDRKKSSPARSSEVKHRENDAKALAGNDASSSPASPSKERQKPPRGRLRHQSSSSMESPAAAAEPFDGYPCDHSQNPLPPRRERERLCEIQNRLNRERKSTSKSPLRGGRKTSPGKWASRCHYRLDMKHVPFVVGKSTTDSHSLTANIQTLVAKLKSHDSGLCDHLRLLYDANPAPNAPATSTLSAPKSVVNASLAFSTPEASPRTEVESMPMTADAQMREVASVLDALQDEFAAMSFEHHEISIQLKALGVDEALGTDGDVRSASQTAEILSLEDRLQDLVAKMNVKGKQINVLKKISKGLKQREKSGKKSKEEKRNSASKSKTFATTSKTSTRRRRERTGKDPNVSSKSVELGEGPRVDVQDGIMVQCIPSTANGAKQLLYGIKDLQRTLKEGDVCWH